jgi:hypothetical protein
MLTPHVSDRSTSEYLDLDVLYSIYYFKITKFLLFFFLQCSYSQLDHLQQMSNITRDLQEVANICCQLGKNVSSTALSFYIEAPDIY